VSNGVDMGARFLDGRVSLLVANLGLFLRIL